MVQRLKFLIAISGNQKLTLNVSQKGDQCDLFFIKNINFLSIFSIINLRQTRRTTLAFR